MRISIKVSGADEAIAAMQGMIDRMGNLATPHREVAELVKEQVRNRIAAGGTSSDIQSDQWAEHSGFTEEWAPKAGKRLSNPPLQWFKEHVSLFYDGSRSVVGFMQKIAAFQHFQHKIASTWAQARYFGQQYGMGVPKVWKYPGRTLVNRLYASNAKRICRMFASYIIFGDSKRL